MKRTCQECQQEYENKDQRSKFCTRSCAATYNGKMHPKRKRTNKCRACNELITSGFTFCDACITNGKHLRNGTKVENRTLGEEITAKKHRGANMYDHIRQHAARVMKNEQRVCQCGYKHHVEVCHIKAIKDFDLTTQISTINARTNLIHLCPNCHWEFDHGILKLVLPASGASGNKPL